MISCHTMIYWYFIHIRKYKMKTVVSLSLFLSSPEAVCVFVLLNPPSVQTAAQYNI